MKRSAFLEKLLNWEYWPSAMFYLPNVPYGIYLALKARSIVFFTAANPAIKSSGSGAESKYKTIMLVPKKHRPKSVFITPKTNFKVILSELKKAEINFPLIVKPDVGFRGLLVKKIKNEDELHNYLKNYPINIIAQEFLDYKHECGIFYHRNPKNRKGKITSITLKRFLSVIGNGTSTLQQLILADERAKLYIKLFADIHKEKMNNIPLKDQVIKLTDVGNHAKGTQFINGNHLISEKLEQTFDELNFNVKGWYYGRVDIKYNSFKELEEGINFKILEINGVISEPTHIYDSANYNYFKALKSIRSHWKYLFHIAYYNNRKLFIPYKGFLEFVNELTELKNYSNKIKKIEKEYRK